MAKYYFDMGILGWGAAGFTIASAVHPCPTLGEINKKVVGKFFS